jgi:hypothetical protein
MVFFFYLNVFVEARDEFGIKIIKIDNKIWFQIMLSYIKMPNILLIIFGIVISGEVSKCQ